MANKIIQLKDGSDNLYPKNAISAAVAGNGSTGFVFPGTNGDSFLILAKRNANNTTDFSMYYGIRTVNSFNVVPIHESNDMKLTITLSGTSITVQNNSSYYTFLKIIPFYE